MKETTKYAPEMRERLVRMVFEQRSEHPSQWAAIQSIAAKIGCTVCIPVKLSTHCDLKTTECSDRKSASDNDACHHVLSKRRLRQSCLVVLWKCNTV